MIAAIVAPVGIRNIVMMRPCLVSGPAADLDDAGADRLRYAGLAVFRAVERVAAFGLVLGLVMGSSRFARRHPSHHLSPARAKDPAGLDPETHLSRSRSSQQRSDQARMPVNSEQDSCSFPVIVFTQKRSIVGKSTRLASGF
jgi:hypothetical protein